jgi:hypothetical protein
VSPVASILCEMQRRGISLRVDGNRLYLKPRHALDDELLHSIAQHKAQILQAVRQSAETVHRFGQPHARLFPFINRRVWTPEGMGTLFTAYAQHCEVVLDSTGQVARMAAETVWPIQ